MNPVRNLLVLCQNRQVFCGIVQCLFKPGSLGISNGMNLKVLKLGFSAVFLVSSASLGAIVVFINPNSAGRLNLALFSATVFLVVFSLFSGLGFWLRKKFITARNLSYVLKMVFRQGALISILLLAYLWLSHFRFFGVWTAVPVLVFMLATEYYFLNLENRKQT